MIRRATQVNGPVLPRRPRDRLEVLGLGVVAGFVAGLFGVGGGILLVPALVLILGVEQRLAHGTSLAATLPIAAAGVVGFVLSGQVDWPAAGCITVGAVVGAVVGTESLRRLPVGLLRPAFAVVLVLAAVRMLVDTENGTGRGALGAGLVLAFVALGLFSGMTAGLFGVGGGIVMVPILTILLGFPQAMAKGTSLAVIIPTALMGTARNLRHGNSDLTAAVLLGGGGIASSFAAALLAVRLDPNLAGVLFAVLLVSAAAQMLWPRRRVAQSGPGLA